jgi:hypothetical protein
MVMLNKQKCHSFFFYRIREKKGWYQLEGGSSREREWESEYSANTVSTCI